MLQNKYARNVNLIACIVMLIFLSCRHSKPPIRKVKVFGKTYEFNQSLDYFLSINNNAYYDDSDNDDTLNVHIGELNIKELSNANDVTIVFASEKLYKIYYKFFYLPHPLPFSKSKLEKIYPTELNEKFMNFFNANFPNAHMVSSHVDTSYRRPIKFLTYFDERDSIKINVDYPIDSMVRTGYAFRVNITSY